MSKHEHLKSLEGDPTETPEQAKVTRQLNELSQQGVPLEKPVDTTGEGDRAVKRIESSSSIRERLKLTGRVLQRLALWGLITIGPMVTPESKNSGPDISATIVGNLVEDNNKTISGSNSQNFNIDDHITPKKPEDQNWVSEVQKEAGLFSADEINEKIDTFQHEDDRSDAEKALAFEKRFEDKGLLSKETKHDKPVVAFVSEENINRIKPNNSEEYTFSGVLSEDQLAPFVGSGKFIVVDRYAQDAVKILGDYKLQNTGITDQKTTHRMDNWTRADYYVVSSAKTYDGKYVLENKIINMKDGSVSSVSVESSKKYSESDNNELAQKTEKYLEELSK